MDSIVWENIKENIGERNINVIINITRKDMLKEMTINKYTRLD